MKKLSVIIPLYNSELFINQAIDSIICQKRLDIEIIIVNDGSTDNSVQKLKKYDDKIRIINIKNSGASVARNIGLKAASAKYVMFLDADDFLNDITVCHDTIKAMEDLKVPMGMFSYKYYDNIKGNYINVSPFPEWLLTETNSEKLICELVKNGVFFSSPCFKIIDREFLLNNNIFFLEGTTAEDIEWYTNLLRNLKSFCVINNNSYIYRINVASSVTASFSEEKCKNHARIISVTSKKLMLDINSIKKKSLLSALAYQYCILLSNSFVYKKNKQLIKEIEELSWLLNYHDYPRIKYIHLIYKIFGGYFTSFILYQYKMHFAKSYSV